LTFVAGAILPLLAAVLTTGLLVVITVVGVSLMVMALLGALGAVTGGAPVWKGALRVVFWGALAMAVTAGVGAAFGVAAH
jgi:VIT1/CCC1 family predicted Fe2+/Mn2+ transporter